MIFFYDISQETARLFIQGFLLTLVKVVDPEAIRI